MQGGGADTRSPALGRALLNRVHINCAQVLLINIIMRYKPIPVLASWIAARDPINTFKSNRNCLLFPHGSNRHTDDASSIKKRHAQRKLLEINERYPPVDLRFLSRSRSITEAINAIAVIRNPSMVPELPAMTPASVEISEDWKLKL